MKKKIESLARHQHRDVTSTWAIRIALSLGLALTALQGQAQTALQAKGPGVKVIAAGQKSVSNFSEMDGLIEAVKQSTLSSQIPGRVVSLNVKAGDRVRAGQVLASIDDRETQTGVMRSQAQLQQSDAELRQLQIALKRTQDLIISNRTVEKVSIGDGIQSFQERELNTADLKNLADTVDKASITLGVNQRNASSQVTVNNTNAQQNNNTHSDLITEALKAKYASK